MVGNLHEFKVNARTFKIYLKKCKWRRKILPKIQDTDNKGNDLKFEEINFLTNKKPTNFYTTRQNKQSEKVYRMRIKNTF